MSRQDSASFALAPDLVLEIHGPARLVAGFRREYGDSTTSVRAPDVEVTFAGRPPAVAAVIAGGHKTVRWRVALSPPDATPLRAGISLGGRPLTFARSLVQGYYVEPLLSVAAVRAGRVLLPAAAFDSAGSALLVMGRSRSGKSTLAARVGARGGAVLGDDQVVIAPGACAPFPRRSRVYSDLRRTAPAAYRALPARQRGALLARAVARRLSFGWVAPSLAVEPFGRTNTRELAIGRVVLIERAAETAAVETSQLRTAAAVEAALDLLEAQRMHLADADLWREALAATSASERETLKRAFEGVQCDRVRLPDTWGASQTVRALERNLGLAG